MRSMFSLQSPDVVEINERYSFGLQLTLHKLFTSAKKAHLFHHIHAMLC